MNRAWLGILDRGTSISKGRRREAWKSWVHQGTAAGLVSLEEGSAEWAEGRLESRAGGIMEGFVCFTEIFGLHPGGCQGAAGGFETEMEPAQVCIFDIKISLAGTRGIGWWVGGRGSGSRKGIYEILRVPGESKKKGQGRR